MKENMTETPIQSVVRVLGGQSAAARKLSELLEKDGADRKVDQKKIWNWLNRDSSIDPFFAPYMELATAESGEMISRQDICPDFPWHLNEGAAA